MNEEDVRIILGAIRLAAMQYQSQANDKSSKVYLTKSTVDRFLEISKRLWDLEGGIREHGLQFARGEDGK